MVSDDTHFAARGKRTLSIGHLVSHLVRGFGIEARSLKLEAVHGIGR